MLSLFPKKKLSKTFNLYDIRNYLAVAEALVVGTFPGRVLSTSGIETLPKRITLKAVSNIIQLIHEGMGDYHFYFAETSDIRRGQRPS